jgi:hypothetical protein
VLHNIDFLGDAAADRGEATGTTAVPETTTIAKCATREGHSEPTSNFDAQLLDHGASRGACETVSDNVIPSSSGQ